MEELTNFYEELKKAVYSEADKLSEKLIEEDPEKYNPVIIDYGYYNNGVGFACYGKTKEFDEDKAFEDAVNDISVDIANAGADYEFYYKFFAENNKLTEALAKLIQTMK